MQAQYVPSGFVLTEPMIEQFYMEGYIYAPGFIDPDAATAINEEYASHESAKGSDEWKATDFTHFHKHAATFPTTASLLSDARIIDAFERILGDRVKLWIGMYAVVGPHGRGLAWHQDNMYTHILGHMLNGFIALDRINEENAGLWIAPRSHLFGRQPNLNDASDPHRRAQAPASGMPCPPMAPGDAVIFHRETLHCSKENRTAKSRRAYAFQVASAACRLAKTGKLLTDHDTLSDRKQPVDTLSDRKQPV